LVEGVSHAMFANQIKTIALPLLLIAGTLTTGAVIGGTALFGGQGDGTTAPPRAQRPTADVRREDRRSGSRAIPAPADHAPRSTSSQLAQQLQAERDSFHHLLTTFDNPEIDDIDRLSRWSSLTLEADLVLGTNEADRVAAYEAHRDRMKRLHELTQKIPVSAQNQPVKADHAHARLREAEQLLEGAKRSQVPGTMGSMMSMMQRGGGRGGRIGITGPGMGMMGGSMMKKGSATVSGGGGSSASSLPANEPPKQEVPAPSTDAVTAAKKSNDQAPKQKGIARAGTRSQSGGGMIGMGGGMGGGFGGGMGGMGGGMGAMSPDALNRQARVMIAASAAELATRETNPNTKSVLKKLEQPLSMSFAAETPLEDVLKHIKQSTTTATDSGIPIYVDPKGLKEAEATLASAIKLDLDGVPLKTTLRLMLKQIGLAYCVRDGVLLISSVQGINEELSGAQSELDATDPNRGGPGGLGEGMGKNFGGMM
jgi:hypothetical protein